MAQTIILASTPAFKGYLIEQSFGGTIHYLGYFIVDVWIEKLHQYITWAESSNEEFLYMNVAFLEKDDNNRDILIGSQLSEQQDWGPFYKISITEFIRLLPLWKELVEANVDTIIIVDNDGKLKVTWD